MKTIDKIKRLRDNNPDFADILEREFPEIVNDEPYVYANALFMVSQQREAIYMLTLESYKFTIKNLRYDKPWKASRFTPVSGDNSIGAYLTKKDFKSMLKNSGVKLENIEIINKVDLQSLHDELF